MSTIIVVTIGIRVLLLQLISSHTTRTSSHSLVLFFETHTTHTYFKECLIILIPLTHSQLMPTCKRTQD